MRNKGDLKASTKDQIEGKLHEVKGKVKEAAVTTTHNPSLTSERQEADAAFVRI